MIRQALYSIVCPVLKFSYLPQYLGGNKEWNSVEDFAWYIFGKKKTCVKPPRIDKIDMGIWRGLEKSQSSIRFESGWKVRTTFYPSGNFVGVLYIV